MGKIGSENKKEPSVEICVPYDPDYVKCLIDRKREYVKDRAKYMLEYKPNSQSWRTVSVGFENEDDAEEYFDKIRKDFTVAFHQEEPDHRIVPLDINKRKGSWAMATRDKWGGLITF